MIAGVKDLWTWSLECFIAKGFKKKNIVIRHSVTKIVCPVDHNLGTSLSFDGKKRGLHALMVFPHHFWLGRIDLEQLMTPTVLPFKILLISS